MDREVSGSRPLNVVRYSDEKGDPLTPISSTPPTPASELAHESDGSGAWRDASFPYQEEKTLQHIEEKVFVNRHRQPSSPSSAAPANTSALASPTLSATTAKSPSASSRRTSAATATDFLSTLRLTAPILDYGPSIMSEKLADSPASASRKSTAKDAPDLDDEDGADGEQDPEYPSPAPPAVHHETTRIFQALRRCLELRDKYMGCSLQRLGDNPQDFDDEDLPPHPESGPYYEATAGDAIPPSEEPRKFAKWRIYPRPPPPRWHWTDTSQGQVPEHHDKERIVQEMEEFEFEKCEIPGACDKGWTFKMDDKGVYQIYTKTALEGSSSEAKTSSCSRPKPEFRIPTLREYYMDLDYILGAISDGPTKSFAFRRLKFLSSKWSMYSLLNEYNEMAEMKSVSHRDFYNVRKVDTHVHHSACMNQKHLLRFIKSKMKKNPEDVVIFRDNRTLTLKEVFDSLHLTAYDLSIDTLDMHAHQDTFHRFDKFNLKYNPIGESRLREIFLKTDNYIEGRYLAELTREVMNDLEGTKYQNSEWRISIYGRSTDEWDKLAKWVVKHKLFSHNVRWLIQIPRLYDVYKQNGSVKTYEDIIRNVFEPLFEVTQDPRTHPELHVFLQRVVGLDSVDDESKVERRIHKKFPCPSEWDSDKSPPYSYWIYYMYANMASLNNWRRERGFNTFVLRPHSGEAGDTDHLASVFLTSHSISHGILLRKVPALQYLFYLRQIGIAMSPLSNNALFLTYERNPIKTFFEIGLNVSLSTDDPLQFHFTKEPLLEEYSVAAHIYKLSQSSLAELARNSVKQSGFEMQIKRHWLGHHWYLPGSEGNDIMRTNVPNSRLTYRHETLLDELENIRAGCALDSTTPVIPHKDLSGPAGTGAVMNLTDDFVGAQAMAGS